MAYIFSFYRSEIDNRKFRTLYIWTYMDKYICPYMLKSHLNQSDILRKRLK